MTASAVTPMMRQYRAIKEEHSDCLLFFRLGDFYEMFAEDALLGSRELEIVLTSRDGGNGTKIPMCGVPFHAVDGYIAKLIAKGYKVAICEQIEDPRLAKGIVKRDVVRIITPGTLVESQMLKENSNNYLMAVFRDKTDGGFGIAYTDISTGEFMATQINGPTAWEKLSAEISRVNPAECILPENLRQEELFGLFLSSGTIGSISAPYDETYIRHNSDAILTIHFHVASLEALGLADMPLAAKAAALVLDFLQQTQKRSLDYLDKLNIYSTSHFLTLDANTRRNLEITSTMRTNQRKGSLLWVLDDTRTAMGARLLKEWIENPLLAEDKINQRLDGVEELVNNTQIASLIQSQLKEMHDMERLISRVCYGNAGPRDLLALRNSLALLPEIFRLLAYLNAPIYKIFIDHFDLLEDIRELIEASIAEDAPLSAKDEGIIKDGYNEQVDELRGIAHGGKSWLLQLEARERERSGIKTLKVGFNKVFGYYIEVTNSNLANVPADYIRKQTLVNAERYITEELKEWENKILTASEKLLALEYESFCEIRTRIAANASRIKNTAEVIAHLDVLQSLAKVAMENHYCRPQVDGGRIIEIISGRHPVIEQIIGPENYVPNDTLFEEHTQQMMLITGPNMAGKSTYMRQVALIVLLARMGSFVPAASANIGRVDRIFTRVGASDDLAAGQSTFMVEMCETANILRHATSDSLIILDEIGRGTSTFDGLAIAWAVVQYIMETNSAKTLFATHYHELTSLDKQYPLIKNYSVAIREKGGDIIFLHKIIRGAADRSYGIQVASLAGLPKEVVRRAKDILVNLESEKNGIREAFPIIDLPISTLAAEEDTLAKRIADEIAALDLNAMTPVEALIWLDKRQRELLNDAGDKEATVI